MNINRNYLTKINFTDKNNTARIKYIVIHYFGGLATAENLAKYWARTYAGASAHYAVGHGGEIFQIVEDDDVAWHCGAKSYKHAECRNTNSIGIEMAVKKKSTATQNATDKDWYFTDETVAATIELTRMLMKKYNIPADHVIRHYDVTGKICPNPYVYNVFEATWQKFKAALMAQEENQSENKYTMICGKAKATAEQIAAYMVKVNPSTVSFAAELSQLYIEEGEKEGIRGDVAAAQSFVETGNYEFKGSAVTIDQNNFCGMGVTANGMKGNSFATRREGVRAQIQHLKAYATEDALKNVCVDPRYKYVVKGCAPYVEYLGIQENPNGKGWAAGAGYGSKILAVLDKIIKEDTKAAGSGAQEATDTLQPLSGTLKVVYEGSDGVNYRTKPDYDKKSVAGAVKKGTILTVVGEVGDFYKVKSGWYVTKRTDLVQFTPKETKRLVKIIYKGSDGVNYRTKPDYNKKSIAGVAKYGEAFTIVGEVGDFYKTKSGYYITKRTDLVTIIEVA
nr:MAG TPA: N-acetylmuramoyl-L-alanine amidase [Caudoviricetes sp.]